MSAVASSDPVAKTLGRFATALAWDDIPPEVRHEAKRAIVNVIGSSIGARRDASMGQALAVLSPCPVPAMPR